MPPRVERARIDQLHDYATQLQSLDSSKIDHDTLTRIQRYKKELEGGAKRTRDLLVLNEAREIFSKVLDSAHRSGSSKRAKSDAARIPGIAAYRSMRRTANGNWEVFEAAPEPDPTPPVEDNSRPIASGSTGESSTDASEVRQIVMKAMAPSRKKGYQRTKQVADIPEDTIEAIIKWAEGLTMTRKMDNKIAGSVLDTKDRKLHATTVMRYLQKEKEDGNDISLRSLRSSACPSWNGIAALNEGGPKNRVRRFRTFCLTDLGRVSFDDARTSEKMEP